MTSQPPKPRAIRKMRAKAKLTQVQAAELVYAGERIWRYWETGVHSMPVALWELFCIKVDTLLAEAVES